MSVEVDETINSISLTGEVEHTITVVESPSHSLVVREEQPNELLIQEDAPNTLSITVLPHTVELTEERYYINISEGFREPQQINKLTDIGDVVGDPVVGSILEYDGVNWVATMADFEIYSDVKSDDSTVTYVGKAIPGSVDTDSVWQLQRITIVGDSIHIDWAGGNNAFDKIYADRESLFYS